jgi:hypothetical protein
MGVRQHVLAQANVTTLSVVSMIVRLLQVAHFCCVLAAASVCASEIPAFAVITNALGEAFIPLLELGIILTVVKTLMGALLMLISEGNERLAAPIYNLSFMLHGLFIGTQYSRRDHALYCDTV